MLDYGLLDPLQAVCRKTHDGLAGIVCVIFSFYEASFF